MKWFVVLALCVLFTLGACAPAATPTPTVDVPAIQTAAAAKVMATLTASVPTATSTPSVTDTPLPTPTDPATDYVAQVKSIMTDRIAARTIVMDIGSQDLKNNRVGPTNDERLQEDFAFAKILAADKRITPLNAPAQFQAVQLSLVNLSVHDTLYVQAQTSANQAIAINDRITALNASLTALDELKKTLAAEQQLRDQLRTLGFDPGF